MGLQSLHTPSLRSASWRIKSIVSNTGTVSLRLGSFSLNSTGVQFNPSMSRTRKATHRTRFEVVFSIRFWRFVPAFFETLFIQGFAP